MALFATRCFYLGITDPERIARGWAEEQAKRAAREEREKRVQQ
ncbi:hypothetical protein [Gemmata obscuriglobus]|nr:hypothetical protein [Gemmata obscuriglobus]